MLPPPPQIPAIIANKINPEPTTSPPCPCCIKKTEPKTRTRIKPITNIIKGNNINIAIIEQPIISLFFTMICTQTALINPNREPYAAPIVRKTTSSSPPDVKGCTNFISITTATITQYIKAKADSVHLININIDAIIINTQAIIIGNTLTPPI